MEDEMWNEDGAMLVETDWGITTVRTIIPVRARRIEYAKMQRWLQHPIVQAAHSVAYNARDLRIRIERIGCPVSISERVSYTLMKR